MDIPEYFSNVVLAQFKATGIPLKVYVNGEYLIIPDMYEISDPLLGSGMTQDGHMVQFDYRMIDHLLVGGNIIDLETYTKAMTGDTPEQAKDKEEEEEETKEESYKLGEITKDVKQARQKALDAEEKALKDKQKALDDEPITEDQHYTFGIGDIVKNKNASCPHKGSMGIIQKIMKLANDMGNVVRYRVVNTGPTYQPGDVLTKTMDQLEPVQNEPVQDEPSIEDVFIDEVDVRKVHGDRKVKNPDTGKDIKLSSALKAKKGTKVYSRARKIYKSLKKDN
tara:strand:- start:1372 stop:2211 length:840 start_codon:yes stop_codon:yes gene_type:complete